MGIKAPQLSYPLLSEINFWHCTLSVVQSATLPSDFQAVTLLANLKFCLVSKNSILPLNGLNGLRALGLLQRSPVVSNLNQRLPLLLPIIQTDFHESGIHGSLGIPETMWFLAHTSEGSGCYDSSSHAGTSRRGDHHQWHCSWAYDLPNDVEWPMHSSEIELGF